MTPEINTLKYSNKLAEVLWEWSLEGIHDEECGQAGIGSRWCALFHFQPTLIDQLPLRRAEGLHPQPTQGEWIVGAILTCDNDGFVEAQLYRRGVQLATVWELIRREETAGYENCH